MKPLWDIDVQEFYRDTMGIRSQPLLEEMTDVTQAALLERGELLAKAGELQADLPILYDGVTCSWQKNQKGQQAVVNFNVQKGDLLLGNMDFGRPAVNNCEALVQTRVVLLPRYKITLWLKQEPEIQQMYQRALSRYASLYQQKMVHVLQAQATERYAWFCQEYPGLVEQISNRYIASCLGITTVTLSRLRHGVATKKNREQKKAQTRRMREEAKNEEDV